VGGRQERAAWAGLKRYLESSQHAADPGAGEQPGPAPAAAAGGNGSQPPGQGRAGAALLAASVAGVALAPLALRRLGRGGSLLVAAGCGALFAQDAQMTLTGAPARLRPLPRLLLRTEVPVSGGAAAAALLACWQQRPGVARVAAAPPRRHSPSTPFARPSTSAQVTAARNRTPSRVRQAWDSWDGPLGPLSAAGGTLLRQDRRPPVFGYQTRYRDAYSVDALIAERSRPADGRSRAWHGPCDLRLYPVRQGRL
jgi:hypothetical protein